MAAYDRSMSAARLWLVMVAVVPGCRQILGIEEPLHQSRLDDAATDTAPGDGNGTCFGAGFEKVCLFQVPTARAFPTAMTINTDLSCDSVASTTFPACVIAGSTIDISASLRVIGSRPIVLVATGALHVTSSGGLDVASYNSGSTGVGAGSIQCASDGNPASSSGGGGGGSFGASGGRGGDGPLGSGGGDPTMGPPLPITLHGGCSGDHGSSPSTGLGGAGGGAVYVISGVNILVDGTINASGAGGGGGASGTTSGGGGGSGGLIGLDAPMVTLANTAKLFSNGGGGGGGGSTGFGGAPGGESPDPIGAAMGGLGGNGNAGTGGNGGAFLMPVGRDGGNAQSTAAGGGGGGGVGVLKVFGVLDTNVGASLSPDPS
jgi:hypothetical protein